MQNTVEEDGGVGPIEERKNGCCSTAIRHPLLVVLGSYIL
jgi:hypothetical protein